MSSYLREALRLTVQYAAAGLTSVAAGLVYLLLRAGGAPPWFGTVVGVAGLVGALAIWHVSGKLLQPGDKSAEIAQAVSDAMQLNVGAGRLLTASAYGLLILSPRPNTTTTVKMIESHANSNITANGPDAFFIVKSDNDLAATG